MTAPSLLRYFFNGDIVIWRNFPEPLYPVARVGLHEIESSLDSLLYKNDHFQSHFPQTKYQMALSLAEHSSKYSWLIFADSGVIALRNWDHLFESQKAEVLLTLGTKGFPEDSFFAIRGDAYPDFLMHWKKAHRDAKSGDRLVTSILKSGSFRTMSFERGEVVRPFQEAVPARELMTSAVVDLTEGAPDEKTKLRFALHMMGTFGDKDGVFLDLMES